jgi:hypothetical protein
MLLLVKCKEVSIYQIEERAVMAQQGTFSVPTGPFFRAIEEKIVREEHAKKTKSRKKRKH